MVPVLFGGDIQAKATFAQVDCSAEQAQSLSLFKLYKGVSAIAGRENDTDLGTNNDSFVKFIRSNNNRVTKETLEEGLKASAKSFGALVNRVLESAKLYLQVKVAVLKDLWNKALEKFTNGLNVDLSFLSLKGVESKLDEIITKKVEERLEADGPQGQAPAAPEAPADN
jgi:hypothetical protein